MLSHLHQNQKFLLMLTIKILLVKFWLINTILFPRAKNTISVDAFLPTVNIICNISYKTNIQC